MAFKQLLVGYLLGGKTEVFNAYLDKLARAELHVFHRSCAAFQLCGCIGLALAIILAMTLVGHAGLSSWVMAGIVGTAVATFLGLVMQTQLITG
jgi:putative flippase GtrA